MCSGGIEGYLSKVSIYFAMVLESNDGHGGQWESVSPIAHFEFVFAEKASRCEPCKDEGDTQRTEIHDARVRIVQPGIHPKVSLLQIQIS